MFGAQIIFFLVNYLILLYTIVECVSKVKFGATPVMEGIDLCPDNDKLRYPIRNLVSRKVNATHTAFSGDATLDEEIGENTGFSITVERWTMDDGWMDISFLPKQRNICEVLTNIPMFNGMWTEVLQAAGVKNPAKCPIPPGNYSLHEYVFDLMAVPIGTWEGKFRATVKLTDAHFEETLFCFVCNVGIINTVE